MSSDSDSSRSLRGHQITYSLIQLRLVGALIILLFLSRIIPFLVALASGESILPVSSVILAAAALPLLPLGISLYLLGAGHKRLPHEKAFLPFLCDSLPFLAIFCAFVIPSAMIFTLNRAAVSLDQRLASPYVHDLTSSYRVLQSFLFCWITGAGLFLIYSQMQKMFKRYNVTSYGFFNSRRLSGS
jgi:hypothetical protein